MNQINNLVKSLCPNGVPYKSLGELGDFYGGLSGKSKEDFKNGNSTFISYMNVYSNAALRVDIDDKVYIKDGEKQNTVQYGDVLFTGSSETPDECGLSSVLTVHTEDKLYLNSFCFGFRFKDNDLFLPDFTKHLFRSSELRKQITRTASGVTRFNVSKKRMLDVRIPVPPVEIQREIVRILDDFTLLTEELEKELLARRKQYYYYLNKLFDEQPTEKRVPINSLGTLTRGKRFVHGDAVDEGVPCIHYGELYTYYGVYASVVKSHIREELRPKMRYAKKNDVIIVGAGENNTDIGVGVAWEGEDDVAVHDACYTLTHSQNPRYISYFLRTDFYHKQIKRYVSEGKICAISADGIGRALIPIPSIDIQNEIVKILDRFNQLITDPNYGLPAEIKARKVQYEYYRDKILRF